MKTDYKKLIKSALSAKDRAFAPYSNFRVGAALLTDTNQIFDGCNIENSSYSLTICAERVAIFKAISNGNRKFKAIAIVSDDPGFTPPCGACRQVLYDLAGNIDFIMQNHKKKIKVVKLKTLIPLAFTNKNLKRSKKKK